MNKIAIFTYSCFSYFFYFDFNYRLSEIAEMEFRRVTVTGEFDHSGEMYLGPRSLLVDGESTYSGKLVSSAANGSSGYYVITPFIRSDTK